MSLLNWVGWSLSGRRASLLDSLRRHFAPLSLDKLVGIGTPVSIPDAG